VNIAFVGAKLSVPKAMDLFSAYKYDKIVWIAKPTYICLCASTARLSHVAFKKTKRI
jgi:hypothetical protein